MNIIILTIDHVYSNLILKKLILKHGGEIKLIIEPTKQIKGKSNISSVLRYLKISGFIYVFNQVIKLGLYRMISIIYSRFSKNVNGKFYNYKVLARKFDIPVVRVPDVNFNNEVKLIKYSKPDIILSVLFSQILRKNVISIAKYGVINFHPAYLPNYKGISPVFWSLVNKEKYAGATVHLIDEGIDTGPIILRKRIKILKSDTEDSLYWRIVKYAPEMVDQAIRYISEKNINQKKFMGGSYHSFPTRRGVTKFLKSGRSFFGLKHYLFEN